ncbi:MAG: cyclase family protein [Actinomycetota bacterium]|nr:cyclase family protein [Actinomycetota bacterium]
MTERGQITGPRKVLMRPRRIVDLSLPLDPRTQVYPGDPEVVFRPATRIEDEGYNVLALELGSHSGTHVDSPFHFFAGGERLDGLDLALFVGPALIADVTQQDDREPIGWEALHPYAEQLGPGTILVLRTGWSDRHYGTERYFDHPYLSAAACERIVELGVRTLAIDALSPDETLVGDGEPRFDVHRLLLGAGGVIAENLANLGAVDFEDPLLCLFPLRLDGDADGSPCRAVALELSG